MKQDVGGVQIYYEIHGDQNDTSRPWIVFSHSLACTTRMWDPQLGAFAQSYRVLAFDTRGHGQSDSPEGPYTMEMLTEDTFQLLSALDIHAAHFVGLSMGGMIGQLLALEHPGTLASLTLADTACTWPSAAIQLFADRAAQAESAGMKSLVESTLSRWFTPAYHEGNPQAVANVGKMIANSPVAGYVGCSHAIPRIDFTDRLKQIICPTLVMVGQQDAGTPPAMAREIHDNLPGSEFFEIEDASHLSNIEQAETFNRELSSFLERQGAPVTQT